MHFAAAISDQKEPMTAVKNLLRDVAAQRGNRRCHLAFLFVSGLYKTAWQPILRCIRQELGNPLLLGCTGGGILGVDKELEFTPAMSLITASLPRVTLHPFQIAPSELEEPQGSGFWIEKLGATPGEEPVGVLLPEPFSCNVMALVPALGAAYPKMPLIGGLASGGSEGEGNALFLDDDVVPEGAIGVLLTGDIELQTIVSQGCRPIGRPYIITKAQSNVILELAGIPAMEALRKLVVSLSEQERAIAQRALFIGVVMNEHLQSFQRGDFLIRNLIGMDPNSGALAVGDQLQVGQTVQFQIRDAAASLEDLTQLLQEKKGELKSSPAGGALLFNCLGRGQDLYGTPHVDIRTIQAAIGNRPVAGFFCNGEIGPVAGRNFIHGFTSSLGLFRHKAGLQNPA